VRSGKHLVIDDLCAAGERRAQAFGHRLGRWEENGDLMAVARSARCTICGRVVYVRVEGDIGGAAGDALHQRCRPERAAPPDGSSSA
jgi:hypothetical protein